MILGLASIAGFSFPVTICITCEAFAPWLIFRAILSTQAMPAARRTPWALNVAGTPRVAGLTLTERLIGTRVVRADTLPAANLVLIAAPPARRAAGGSGVTRSTMIAGDTCPNVTACAEEISLGDIGSPVALTVAGAKLSEIIPGAAVLTRASAVALSAGARSVVGTSTDTMT